MGVYHCDCGKTLCGETFPCPKCGYGGGDGNTLCEGCADMHCASPEDQEKGAVLSDLALIKHIVEWGFYKGTSKHDRDFTLQSASIRACLKKLVSDPDGCFKALLDEDKAKKPAKRRKKGKGGVVA